MDPFAVLFYFYLFYFIPAVLVLLFVCTLLDWSLPNGLDRSFLCVTAEDWSLFLRRLQKVTHRHSFPLCSTNVIVVPSCSANLGMNPIIEQSSGSLPPSSGPHLHSHISPLPVLTLCLLHYNIHGSVLILSSSPSSLLSHLNCSNKTYPFSYRHDSVGFCKTITTKRKIKYKLLLKQKI